MSRLFKKSLQESGVFSGFTDYHTHILPGVDDGVRTMDDAIAVLDRFQSLGVTDVWCTPHIMEDIPNTTKRIKDRFAELCEAYTGPVKLHLASENMLDALFMERLKSGDVLPLGDGYGYLLVETRYSNPPDNLDGILADVLHAGYIPVLAHPERYAYMTEEDYERLVKKGVKFQLNLLSLTGAYGADERKKAEYILKKGWYSYYGTDIHSLNVFEAKSRQSINVKL